MIKKKTVYQRPVVEYAALEDLPVVCVSPNGSNENYSNEDFDW